MKICIVTTEYPEKTASFGGIGTYQRHLARALSGLGHEVHVLISDALRTGDFFEEGIFYHERVLTVPGWLKHDLFSDHLPVRILTGIFLVDRELRMLNKKHSFQIIQTTNYQTPCIRYLYRKNKPLVVTWVNTLVKTVAKTNFMKMKLKQSLPAWFEKVALRRSDYLVTSSRANKEEMVRLFSLRPDSIEVLPLGISMPAAPQPSPGSGNEVSFLYVGRLEGRKGIDILLGAMPGVLLGNPDVKFILAGRDYQQTHEKLFFKEHPEFRGRVFFKGEVPQEELERLYQSCDVFVSPARYESFGLTFVEAMSYGKPVVGCVAGAVPEVVEDGVTGLLVEPENVQALEACLSRLASDSALRVSLGDAAWKISREKFSCERMARDTALFYGGVA